MNKYKLKYSPSFYNDFNNIIVYIKCELKNVIAADNLINKVEKEILHRLKNPSGYESFKTKEENIHK